ncbi:hypothetical protein COCVIDRAFT_96653, partial [Bipolaris victoriae FI3]
PPTYRLPETPRKPFTPREYQHTELKHPPTQPPIPHFELYPPPHLHFSLHNSITSKKQKKKMISHRKP